MIDSRHFPKIIAAVVSVAVVLCICAMLFSDALTAAFGGSGVTMQYETALFDTSSVMSVNIRIDEDQWNDLLANAINEEYYPCDVTVNGTTVYNAAIRAKGNTSLSNIANDSTTDRYSFKVEFDHYVSGQTCLGLDKLVLNNNYADATNMKEALVYDMFAFLGADASLYNYANISINGQYWGVYLALESVEDSFLMRNYGVSDGNLYKPDSMNFGGAGGMKDKTENELNEVAERFSPNDTETDSAESSGQSEVTSSPTADASASPGDTSSENTAGQPAGSPPSMPSGGVPSQDASGFTPSVGGGMMQNGGGAPSGQGSDSSGGAELNYIDDDADSYSTIWDGEVNSTGSKDHKRVVTALKNISEQNDLSTYMDVDNLLKYMAVHTFAVNLDSLTGNMAHNYYLYEKDGQLNLIPWDYNLAWGGFQSSGGNGADSTVNFPIDTPFSSGISLEDREFFAALLENEDTLAQYHEYLRILCEEYFDSGHFDEVYNRIHSQIDSLVETDPTAFYSYDEYTTASETLCSVLKLRVQSIEGQLNGTIPSTTDGQSADSSSLIDASQINLSSMGSMGGGGGGMQKDTAQQDTTTQQGTMPQGGMQQGGMQQGGMPQGNTPQGNTGSDSSSGGNTAGAPSGNGFSPNGNFTPGSRPGGNTAAASPGTGGSSSDQTDSAAGSVSSGSSAGETQGGMPQDITQNGSGKTFSFPGGAGNSSSDTSSQAAESSSASGSVSSWIWYGACLIVMVLFIALAWVYRRRKK